MKISNESLTRSGNQDNQSGIHSRTNSVGGSSIGSNNQVSGYPPPPSGPRVVLGRETTPTMGGSGSNQNITNARNGENNPTKIPREVWDRFEGKSREVFACCKFFGIDLYMVTIIKSLIRTNLIIQYKFLIPRI